MACGPDVIFIGGWLAGSYDALSQIAPVVYLATDSDLGVVESVRQNTRAIASLFGLEDTAGELMTGFDSRVAALASFSEGRTAIVWARARTRERARGGFFFMWWFSFSTKVLKTRRLQ